MIQERSRELAITESLDGGKPIRESRDVDVPLAAAHFFYYAGWADKLNIRFSRTNTKITGCMRTDHSLEFSRC
jgi:aldehyde dehydrogenase (NAD+)